MYVLVQSNCRIVNNVIVLYSCNKEPKNSAFKSFFKQDKYNL